MKINIEKSIYEVKTTSKFNKELKKALKQNKDRKINSNSRTVSQ